MTQSKCYKCGFFDEGNFCSKCGSPLKQPSGLSAFFKPILGPVYEYFKYMKQIIDPKQLSDDIKTNRILMHDAVGFLISAIAISFLFEFIFPDQIIFPNLPPILSEILTATFTIFVAVFFQSPIHYWLNKKDKSVSFKQFSIAIIVITALFYPWLTLINGILFYVTQSDQSSKTSNASLYFYGAAFSRMYNKTISEVIGAFGKLILLFLVPVIGYIIFNW